MHRLFQTGVPIPPAIDHVAESIQLRKDLLQKKRKEREAQELEAESETEQTPKLRPVTEGDEEEANGET